MLCNNATGIFRRTPLKKEAKKRSLWQCNNATGTFRLTPLKKEAKKRFFGNATTQQANSKTAYESRLEEGCYATTQQEHFDRPP